MRQYVIDAFTDSVFHGNQAAVCVMEKWPSEEMMMNITRENNFSETAFTVKEGEKWHLRWFTPEVRLIFVDMLHWEQLSSCSIFMKRKLTRLYLPL